MKIINQAENRLLNRKEILAEIEHLNSPTPSYSFIIQKAAETLSVSQDLILLKQVKSAYGGGKPSIVFHVYNDKKDLELLEKVSKKRKQEAQKPEQQPAESAKPAKPAK